MTLVIISNLPSDLYLTLVTAPVPWHVQFQLPRLFFLLLPSSSSPALGSVEKPYLRASGPWQCGSEHPRQNGVPIPCRAVEPDRASVPTPIQSVCLVSQRAREYGGWGILVTICHAQELERGLGDSGIE